MWRGGDPAKYRAVIRNPSGDRNVASELVKYSGPYFVTLDLTRLELQPTDTSLAFLGFGGPMEIIVELPKPPAAKQIAIRPLTMEVYNKGYNKEHWGCTLYVRKNGEAPIEQYWALPVPVTDNAERLVGDLARTTTGGVFRVTPSTLSLQ